MDDDLFEAIIEGTVPQLSAWMRGLDGAVIYSAFFDDLEVAIVGRTMPDRDPGHTVTRPIAILVDERVFDRLTVEESGRYDGDGVLREPKSPGASVPQGTDRG